MKLFAKVSSALPSVGDRRDISHLQANSFNPDQVIVLDWELLALEEDKAHYVDKCFLSRKRLSTVREWCKSA